VSKHPRQRIHRAADGKVRFVKNEIVRYLLDHGGISLNDLGGRGFDDDDFSQFAQLIGYSINGYAELDYANGRVVAAVFKKAETL
jgi:hypothetical protein